MTDNGHQLTETLPALARTYAEVLRRQGVAAAAFVRWSRVTGRAHDFVWVGGVEEREAVLFGRGPIRVSRTSRLFESVHKMHTTAKLNPYEREVRYGYPYVIGRQDGETVRAPLLTISIRIEEDGDGFSVHAADEVVHLNALPFNTAGDPTIYEQRIARLISETPSLPLHAQGLRQLVDVLTREFPHVEIREAKMDGSLLGPPSEPKGTAEQGLWLVDQAALFIAPKTSYFLTSDLDRIGSGVSDVDDSALAPLLSGPGSGSQVDFDDATVDKARMFFPFPSNRAQRRAALLVEDPTTRVVRVEGPPGTGKSLTIANLACHLAATGKTVLVTSQRDKALEVVDSKLRELGVAELPMTLLHRDRESKNDLLRRLERVRKERSQQEVAGAFGAKAQEFEARSQTILSEAREYEAAILAEAAFERAHRALLASRGASRLLHRVRFWRARRAASRQSPRTTDVIAESVSETRSGLLNLAVEALVLGREHAVAAASREERAGLRELAAVLKRDQTKFKNFSLFDQLKDKPDRAQMLLKLLPVWVMTPDDVARLFPCVPGLFDVVIVDEGSQVDLPSVTPVAFRGKKLVVLGDSKQMQPRRFAFTNQDVTRQAWQHHGMAQIDPQRWLHPSEQSLLTLTAIRAQEEVLLNEHFRSLPPIIEYSNERWYDNQLRVMTDEARKKFGAPDQPIMQLHHVPTAMITNGSQENEGEARALVDLLSRLVVDPDYFGASIGVMCLFEEQVALVQDLVAERIAPEEWDEHQLVVINPDGFQGDERDVILYSLSYDAKAMSQAAISARMSDQPHIQGMLNVAFTRARDEIHVFHTAGVEEFTFAGGRAGALTEWLQHCASVQARDRTKRQGTRLGMVDSQFEADVADELRGRGLTVLHQYPACGFNIDLVVRRQEGDERVAVECDGEQFHLDEHGQLKAEDIERQAILERAGWRVVRVPYRKWVSGRASQIQRVLDTLDEEQRITEPATEDETPGSNEASPPNTNKISISTGRSVKQEWVSRGQAALIDGLKEGFAAEEDLFVRARDLLGVGRLTQKLRSTLQTDAADLVRRRLIAREDDEYFLLPAGRGSELILRPQTPIRRREYRQRR